MSRDPRERISEEDILDFEKDPLDFVQKNKKWYQFKSVGKYLSGMVAWLPGPMSQFISDSWLTSDSWQKLSQFFSSESSAVTHIYTFASAAWSESIVFFTASSRGICRSELSNGSAAAGPS